jgi:hypothetical protein
MTDASETTDLTLFIRTSGEEIAPWNRQRIVDALLREAGVDYLLAAEISKDVEKQIVASGIGHLTTSLVRELVNAKLTERGLEKERRLHGRMGFPLYDVRRLILHPNKENANTPHSPEGTNLLFAEGIKKEFALYDVFPSTSGRRTRRAICTFTAWATSTGHTAAASRSSTSSVSAWRCRTRSIPPPPRGTRKCCARTWCASAPACRDTSPARSAGTPSTFPLRRICAEKAPRKSASLRRCGL